MAILGQLESMITDSSVELRVIPTSTPPNRGTIVIDSESIDFLRVDWDGSTMVLKNLVRIPIDMTTHLAGATLSIGDDIQLKAPKYIHVSDATTGGDDIDFTTSIDNAWECTEIDIHRTNNAAITLSVYKVVDTIEYLQIQETGWTGTDYSIPITIDCTDAANIKVETTGSAVGNIYLLINGRGLL